MNAYYVVFEALITDKPGESPRFIKDSMFLMAPPLTPKVMEQLRQQLGKVLTEEHKAAVPVPALIVNIIQLARESGIITPGGGR